MAFGSTRRSLLGLHHAASEPPADAGHVEERARGLRGHEWPHGDGYHLGVSRGQYVTTAWQQRREIWAINDVHG